MCGIAGFIDFRNKSSKEYASKMADAEPHRGPDGSGAWFKSTDNGQIGLGHRRLSILDLSTAAGQPMEYAGLRLIFNGEIYNFNEIRDQLISEGHHFNTTSDTEVILHGWKKWGVKAIDQWRGMFALAIYDEEKEELVIIRDRPGVKPLYYYYKDGLFLFGSELKALIAHPDFKKEINADAVASYMQYGNISHPHCIYKDTYKLPPGSVLRMNCKTREISIEKYWNIYDQYNKPKLKIGLEDAIDETEKILTKSFQYRMVSDVPVGVFLSGGYDSSCVTALLQKNMTDKLKTFTIGSTDEKLNEAPFAKKIAEHLGTNHTEHYCTSKEALDIIPTLSYYYDEPFADSSAIPTILVSRIAREKVVVALSADGGDEIFAGYNRYDYLTRFGGKLQKIPPFVRKLAASAMDVVSSESIPYFNKQYNFHSRYSKIRNLLKNPSPTEFIKNLSQAFTDKEIKALFAKEITHLATPHSSNELKKEFADPLSAMMAIDYYSYMVDDILHKVDRATMSVSLEGREPFLDQHIIEWAAQLPSDYKYRNGQKKYILKEIVHRHIPKEIMERPKMGFGIPMESWLQNELKPMVREYLSEEALAKHGLFNQQEVNRMVKKFYSGKTDEYVKLWYLLVFQMWYKEWM